MTPNQKARIIAQAKVNHDAFMKEKVLKEARIRLDRNKAEAAAQSQPQRMANPDGVDGLLKSLESDVAAEAREADLESDAIKYISNRAVDLNQMGFDTSQPMSAGALGKAEETLQALGTMQGNVPMPLTRTGRDTQERVFLKYEDNDVTGQQQVVPMLDPNDDTQAIKLTYGVPVTDKFTNADEYVSEAALKMMGYKVEMPQSNKLADFQVIDDKGEAWAFDGMQIPQGSSVDMQTHSAVGINQAGGGTLSVRQLQQLLDERTANGENVIDVIDDLSRQRKTNFLADKAGKVLRGDHGNGRIRPEEEYDALMMPEYNKANRDNRNRDERPNARIIAPQGMWMANLPDAFDAIKAGGGGSPKAVRNKFNSQLHKINVPMNKSARFAGNDVFIDLIKARPELAQLLDTVSMEKRRVN